MPVSKAGRITRADARRAGYGTVEWLLRELDRWPGTGSRIELRHAGPDPRAALRKRTGARPEDAPRDLPLLRLIAKRPAVRAADLAAELSRDKEKLKRDVRARKALGFTESLGSGYRLSPRGRAILGLH